MKVLFFTRRTLHLQPGGDRVHVLETMEALRAKGHDVQLVLETKALRAALKNTSWDVLHSFNIGRIADQYPCYQARKQYPKLKWAISTIWVDYRAYDRKRLGLLRHLPYRWIEFTKLLGRALLSGDRWPALALLWLPSPFQQFAWAADYLFCTSEAEAHRIKTHTGLGQSVQVVPPGAEHIWAVPAANKREGWVVLGRIEGLKNQVAAVEAWIKLKGRGMNEPLTIIGDPAPNHPRYVRKLKTAIARANTLGVNVSWEPAVPPDHVPHLLAKARGVLIPSLFETYGLTALEGLRSGCQVVLSSAAESAAQLAPWVHLSAPNAGAIADAVWGAHQIPKEAMPSDDMSWSKAAERLELAYQIPSHFIAFTGSRGMPNRYGGYEEMVDHVGRGLADRGHRVWISTSSAHPEPHYHYPGIHRAKHWDPETWMGSAGQFVYDWISLRSLKRFTPDAHIALGTTSSGPWLRWAFWRGPSPLAVHMDGLEWMRGKYSPAVRSYLRRAEKWAAESAHYLISDNPGISDYLRCYPQPIVEIAYGVDPVTPLGAEALHAILAPLGLLQGAYTLILCRLVPENNVAMALQGLLDVGTVAVVGDWNNPHANDLLAHYGHHPNFIRLNAHFDPTYTQALRQGCQLYVHGHSAGGTNPGLLQAMAAGCRIAAHDNPFNRAVLGLEAAYFGSSQELLRHYQKVASLPDHRTASANYNWNDVTLSYAELAGKMRLNEGFTKDS
ncbi:MAG: hypothetical protein ABR98_02545 [Cryomorphaceae bacterium BACL7 MAG-120910-bin2]|nr:MAG: hypothetical protein ABR98_02545 [Cryomorphaceae bacterium BACL7 MAG-120910-bin2]KRO69618.1 MAG: hypothetical protein ABR88_06420 [Cryomorphaceae bacterium BACL7 MAG-120322-bin74]NQW25285.1 DUF1972 domain-containing protein [Cryomorphaceae bacterium]